MDREITFESYRDHVDDHDYDKVTPLIHDIHDPFIKETLLEDLHESEHLNQFSSFDENTEQSILESIHPIHTLDEGTLNEIASKTTNNRLSAQDIKKLSDKDRKHAHIESNPYALTRKSAKSTVDERFDAIHEHNPHNILFTVISLLIVALTFATEIPYLLLLLVMLLAYKIFLKIQHKKMLDGIKDGIKNAK